MRQNNRTLYKRALTELLKPVFIQSQSQLCPYVTDTISLYVSARGFIADSIYLETQLQRHKVFQRYVRQPRGIWSRYCCCIVVYICLDTYLLIDGSEPLN